jgi:amidase
MTLTSKLEDPFNAFCKDSDAYLRGATEGPLSGLSFAAKDIFDVAGHVTGGGNPDWKASHDPAEATAWVVQALVDAGATMVGKTITDELTRGIFGENPHYGTPANPRAPGRVPGGSSSGSAAAVAGGLVDFALGSDTGGSVRVPASFCGLYGLRPTHGRIPVHGMLTQAPTYDTVGWFARDAETFARVRSVLFPDTSPQLWPTRLVIAEDAFDQADREVSDALQPAVELVCKLVCQPSRERLAPVSLSVWSEQQQVLQSREAWESVRDWVDRVNPRLSFEVADRYVMARSVSDAQVEAALAGRAAIAARMDEVFADNGTIVCLPTTVAPAPPVGQKVSERHALRLRNSALTSIAGNTGRPQISLPVAEVRGLPVGLSLLGKRGGDEMLIMLARDIAAALFQGP